MKWLYDKLCAHFNRHLSPDLHPGLRQEQESDIPALIMMGLVCLIFLGITITLCIRYG